MRRLCFLLCLCWLAATRTVSAAPENLALRRIASASQPAAAQNAVDGKTDTCWTSGASGEQYLYVDLDATCKIEHVKVVWGPHAGAGEQLQTSLDAEHWSPLAPAAHARYVRLLLPDVKSAVDVAELQVVGTCDGERPARVGTVFPPHANPHPSGWRLQDARLVKGEGEQISQAGFTPTGWYEATVPGTVLTTLVDDGVLPDPLYGLNNRRIDDSYDRHPWWYRGTLNVPAGWQGRKVWLDFGGINWKADVWMNGVWLGNIKGAFTRASFDATPQVNWKGPNVVAVLIHNNDTPGTPLEQTRLAGTGANGGKLGADNPTFHATVGWDWIPGIRDRDIGIWQPVTLRSSGKVVLDDPQIITKLPLPRTDSAEVSVNVEVRNTGTEATDDTLYAELAGQRQTLPLHLEAGEQRMVELKNTHLEHPRLWWPNGYGPQNLYHLYLNVGEAKLDTQFGVRQMSFDQADHELVIMVNGQKIMCRGGNWGMDEAMKRIPRERLDACLHMHALAHVTMIRNWIGMSTEPDFYDLCDKYGILVWNDFWLANPVDGPDPVDDNIWLSNAADCLKRYRNHPCIALWCGRNEGDPPAYIDEVLGEIISSLDGTRRYQPSSDSHAVHGHGPYCYQEPTRYFTELAHGFTTEIGLPSVPSADSMRQMMPQQDWWPINDTWAYHDFCHGAQDPARYLASMDTRFGAAHDLDDFCRKSQMLNYETYRAIFEAWNRKMWHDCSGVLLWMSHPCWPSTVWQLYAYDLEPTAALYGVQKGCEPLHVQMALDDHTVSFVNNSFGPLAVKVSAEVHGLDGKLRWQHAATVQAAANACTDAFAVPAAQLQAACLVKVVARNAAGHVLSDNLYWTAAHPADLRAMNRMTPVRLSGSARPAGAGYDVTLRNPSPRPAVMVRVTLRDAATGARVLPAFCSENYLTLLGGESRTIHLDAQPSRPIKIGLDGWNVVPSKL